MVVRLLCITAQCKFEVANNSCCAPSFVLILRFSWLKWQWRGRSVKDPRRVQSASKKAYGGLNHNDRLIPCGKKTGVVSWQLSFSVTTQKLFGKVRVS